MGQAWAGRLSLLEEKNLSAPGSVFRLFYSQSHPGGCSKAVAVNVGALGKPFLNVQIVLLPPWVFPARSQASLGMGKREGGC